MKSSIFFPNRNAWNGKQLTTANKHVNIPTIIYVLANQVHVYYMFTPSKSTPVSSANIFAALRLFMHFRVFTIASQVGLGESSNQAAAISLIAFLASTWSLSVASHFRLGSDRQWQNWEGYDLTISPILSTRSSKDAMFAGERWWGPR